MAEIPDWQIKGDWFDVCGCTTTDYVDGFGFKWERDGRSSTHFPLDWSSPGE